MNRISSNIEKALWFIRNFGFRRLIYSAGMPRSGSTLLFNILRLILQKEYENQLSYGWIEDVETLPQGDIYLIKTHHLNRMGIWRAYKTFYTYRDIRDVLVSRLRKFDKDPTITMVRYYIQQDQLAKKHSDFTFQYETMAQDLPGVVSRIASELNIRIEAEEIIQRLPNPNKVNVKEGEHSKETLLHNDHVTGTVSGEWKDILSQILIDQIHKEFEWWFIKNGYEV